MRVNTNDRNVNMNLNRTKEHFKVLFFFSSIPSNILGITFVPLRLF